MPIYEFYCEPCNTVFNFLSSVVDTTSVPRCPLCTNKNLVRQVSLFSTPKNSESMEAERTDFDGTAIERGFESLVRSSEQMDSDDPRQLVCAMRKFAVDSGVSFSDTVEDAMVRLEAGGDPAVIEQELGDLFSEDSISFLQQKNGLKETETVRDEMLYKLDEYTG